MKASSDSKELRVFVKKWWKPVGYVFAVGAFLVPIYNLFTAKALEPYGSDPKTIPVFFCLCIPFSLLFWFGATISETNKPYAVIDRNGIFVNSRWKRMKLSATWDDIYAIRIGRRRLRYTKTSVLEIFLHNHPKQNPYVLYFHYTNQDAETVWEHISTIEKAQEKIYQGASL